MSRFLRSTSNLSRRRLSRPSLDIYRILQGKVNLSLDSCFEDLNGNSKEQ